jgi:uncharacterized Fe-S radical SAM superfamily protein PflX
MEKMYQAVEQAIALHRHQIYANVQIDDDQSSKVKKLWEEHKQTFQQIASSVRFSNHNKLEKCLYINDIGKDINHYEDVMNVDTAKAEQ